MEEFDVSMVNMVMAFNPKDLVGIHDQAPGEIPRRMFENRNFEKFVMKSLEKLLDDIYIFFL